MRSLNSTDAKGILQLELMPHGYTNHTTRKAMAVRCRWLLGLCERWQPGGDGARQWRHRLEMTESWPE